jgi:tetratricopeptide (TPR) repeat protein
MNNIEKTFINEAYINSAVKKPFFWIALALLGLLVMTPYLQVATHEFINWDDPVYIFNNQVVASGLTWSGASWAFITGHAANWHPLTWLSHMLDTSLFGPTSRGAHLVNVTWHILNSILVYILFQRLGASLVASFFMAAFFGLHPLHVESVAWASERKDLLCAFFFLAATISYLHYVRKPTLKSYTVVTCLFILSLLSKPMAVTWPCVALMLDYWPNQRLKRLGSLLYEKLPWLVISIISSLITLMVQEKGHAIKSLGVFPLTSRLANTGISYLEYVRQSLWPVGLTVYYPHPQTINIVLALSSWLSLVIITVIALRQKVKRPYLLWGWLFFLGVLMPVNGLIQVGNQAHADRYTYLPQLGLILAAGLFLDQILVDKKIRRVGAAAMCVPLAFLWVLTFKQVSYWKNSQSLFTQNLEVAGENFLANFNLATASSQANKLNKAVFHFLQAAKLNPQDPDTYINLGNTYQRLGQYNVAVTTYLEALRLDPKRAVAYLNLGNCYVKLNQDVKAEEIYNKAIENDPSLALAYFSMADLKSRQGLFAEAATIYAQAVRLDPTLTKAAEFRSKAR